MARILVIDDEELLRDTFEDALQSAGHDLATAENGIIGVERYREGIFDLVITDIIMPDKEGLQTIIEIREIEPEQRIIAVSGGGRDLHLGYLESARMFGAVETLAKPIFMHHLLARVTACLDECHD